MKKILLILSITLLFGWVTGALSYADSEISASVIQRMLEAASGVSVPSPPQIPTEVIASYIATGNSTYLTINEDILQTDEYSAAIVAEENAKAQITGNVKNSGENATAVFVNGEAVVDINGTIIADGNNGKAIAAYDGSEITVLGDVNGDILVHGIDNSFLNYLVDPIPKKNTSDPTNIEYYYTSNEEHNGNNGSSVVIDGDLNGRADIYGGSTLIVNGSSGSIHVAGKDANNNSSVQIDGDVNGGLIAVEGGAAIIKQDISGYIDLYDQGTFVHVGGDVHAPTSGMVISSTVQNGAQIQIDGTFNGSILFVKGETSLAEIGSDAIGGFASLDGGSVIVNGNMIGAAFARGNNSSIRINGNVTVGDGTPSGGPHTYSIYPILSQIDYISPIFTPWFNAEMYESNFAASTLMAFDGGTIEVGGNVTSDLNGIEVVINDPGNKQSFVTVDGIVSGKEKAIGIAVANGVSIPDIVNIMPQIIVQSLESEKELVAVTAPGATEEEKQILMDALVNNLFYIVNTDKVDTAKIAIYGTEVVDGYVVAKENSTITLQSTKEGYVVCNVEAGKYATVTENNDGSYTILVNRGGDLNLSADAMKDPNYHEGSQSDFLSWTDHLYELSFLNYDGITDYSTQPWYGGAAGQMNDAENFIMPDYQDKVLYVNMIGRTEVTLFKNDLETFFQAGITGVNFKTLNSSYNMAITDLLNLIGANDSCMASRTENELRLIVFNNVVFSVALVKTEA